MPHDMLNTLTVITSSDLTLMCVSTARTAAVFLADSKQSIFTNVVEYKAYNTKFLTLFEEMNLTPPTPSAKKTIYIGYVTSRNLRLSRQARKINNFHQQVSHGIFFLKDIEAQSRYVDSFQSAQ